MNAPADRIRHGRESRPLMLTISQLATYVGVTVRAVRHYHKRGLLAEPERDDSGYRRYDAAAVIRLIRIKSLADAAVPLARIEEVLEAEPEEFSRAIADIDKALAAKIRDLKRQRERIAKLDRGENLVLPDDVVDYLNRLRAVGVSPQTVEIERDGWILLMVSAPDLIRNWVTEKRSALANPEFQRLYLAYDQALDWDPADSRLEKLADDMVEFVEQQRNSTKHPEPSPTPDVNPQVTALLSSYLDKRSRAWTRLGELCADKMIGRNNDRLEH